MKKFKKSNKNVERHDNSILDLVTQIGRDVSQTTQAMAALRYSAATLNRSLLSELYIEHGIIQVLIDQPVDDGFRGGIEIKCPEMTADDIAEIDYYLENEGILEIYKTALKWNRLYGGAGLIINAGQTMDQPFNLDMIKPNRSLEFYAADRWELAYTPTGNSILDQFKQDTTEVPFNYYGHRLHKDSVIKLINKQPPSLLKGQYGGWGMSEIEKIFSSWNQYLKHQSVTYEVLDESKIDVFKINGFNAQMATKNGVSQTASRIQAASMIKNFQNALVVDANDDYEQKTLAFAGLAEILTQIRIGLACDLRMPMTKLFGMSASGFNSGEDDIENYNAMIESEIRSKTKTGLVKILKIICKKIFDDVPEKISFEFKPLRIMSHKEQSALKTEAINRVSTVLNSGLCTSEKAVEIINSEKIFPIDLEPDEAVSQDEMNNLNEDKQNDET